MTYSEIYKILSFEKQNWLQQNYYVCTKQFNHHHFGSVKQRKAQIQLWTKASKGALLGSVGTTNIILVSSCRSIFNDSSTFFSLAKIHIKSLKFW